MAQQPLKAETADRQPESTATTIGRRRVILMLAGGMLAWSRMVDARGSSEIGFLSGASPEDYGPLVTAFCRGLNSSEGEDVSIEYRWARGRYERLPALAADLVFRQPKIVITSGGDVAALAAKALTSTTPIVFADAIDPVSFGLVADLARPGRNATGVRVFTIAYAVESLKLLSKLVPGAAVMALLVNPESPLPGATLATLRAAAQAGGFLLITIEAETESELLTGFARIGRYRADGLLVIGDALFNSRRDVITALASKHGLPTLYPWREFVTAGGLMSYGPNLSDAYRQAGVYAGQILGGANPAEMPVVSTKMELVVNLKAALRLGLKLPPSLVARANEVIK